MKNVAMWVCYDGSAYSGWQRQKNAKSVQGEIERCLSGLLKNEISIAASGRTDAGVHAFSQCFCFWTDLKMPVESLVFALNSRLPYDIRILKALIMPESFHSRYSAIGKTYIYKMYRADKRDPFKHNYYHYQHNELNEDAIRKAMQYFVGTYDFSGFMASGSKVKDTIRTIYKFDLEINGDEWIFEISGDGFLYNMVRIIIGLLIEVGKNNISPDEISPIILSKDRFKARWTAPPNGLYLKEVNYEEIENIIDR